MVGDLKSSRVDGSPLNALALSPRLGVRMMGSSGRGLEAQALKGMDLYRLQYSVLQGLFT